MLTHLHIQNYALIDHLEIDFHEGLNIITGETGAGKSILLGALSLILGQRAETNVLKDDQKSCIVEGTFDIKFYNLHNLFRDNDIDYQDITSIRRQVSPNGKSRAFINETPVNLQLLKELVGSIIDIHSQHENLLLANSTFQLKVLDSFAGTLQLLKEYKSLFLRYKQVAEVLNQLKQQAESAKLELDYLNFQLTQLNEAKPLSGELAELEALQKQLTHAEEIKQALNIASQALNGENVSSLLLLKEVEHNLKKIAPFFHHSQPLLSRIEGCRIELKDISTEIELHNEKVQANPEQLSSINQRIDLIFSLLQKHRVKSEDELIEIHRNLQHQVNEISSYDEQIDIKRIELEEITIELRGIASDLSKKRRQSISKLEENIIKLLNQLGMPYPSFKVEIKEAVGFQPDGIDAVSFLFSANKQVPMQELSRVASGGELSRLMLSLKSLLVRALDLPTIIFDEIDTGVSGEVADRVGTIIHSMAANMQVINITHLPQIACKGMNHFLVYKEQLQHTTITRIKLLSKDERIVEIAKMLSGEKLSEAALTNARHLLSENSD